MAVAELLHRLLSKSLQLGDRLPIDVVGRLEVEITNSGGIVDHNLDVPNPQNGWYVRWENGLQVCWIPSIFAGYTNIASLNATWTYPAAFVARPAVIVSVADVDDPVNYAATNGDRSLVRARLVTNTSAGLQVLNRADNPFASGDQCELSAIAVGRWK